MIETLFLVIISAFAISYVIEVTQLSLSLRFPSFIDVLFNTLGAAIGLSLFLVGRFLSTLNDFSFSLFFVLGSLLLYLIFVTILLAFFRESSSFHNWDSSYPLTMGNEPTGNRPWKGSINQIEIFNQSIPLRQNQSIAKMVSAYRKFRIGSFSNDNDQYFYFSGQEKDKLKWFGNLNLDAPPPTASFDGNNWLGTVCPPVELNKNLIRTGKFTIYLKLESRELDQKGPARIFTLSNDADHRNLTIGQMGTKLILRIRTPLTGVNGANPQVAIPNVFEDCLEKEIFLSFNGSTIKTYVNNTSRSPYHLFSPWASIQDKSILSSKGIDWIIYKSLFFMIIFTPIGIVALFVTNGNPGFRNLAIAMAFIFGISFLLNTLFTSSNIAGLLENALFSEIFFGMPFGYILFFKKLNQLNEYREKF